MKSNESFIKCKYCRQYILSNKMFLHEGFCQRNNIFCEHCEKVYLRGDYEKHILDISKDLSNKNKENIFKRLKSSFKSFINDSENNTFKINKNEQIYEKIPVMEEYKIRKPIILAPDGSVVNYKNSEKFLSLFDFDSIKKNINNLYKYEYDSHMILNTENKNSNYYNNQKNKKIGHLYSLHNNNIFLNGGNYILVNLNQNNKKNLTIDIKDNNIEKIENQYESLTTKNYINENNFGDKIRAKSNNTQEKEIKNKDKPIEIYQRNKNNIIINNNNITFTSNYTNNEMNNIFNNKDDKNKNNNKKTETWINIEKLKINEFPKYKTKTNIFHNKYLKNKGPKVLKTLENISNREPMDNIIKSKYHKNSVLQIKKKPQNRIIKNNKYSLFNSENKNNCQNIRKYSLNNKLTDNIYLHRKLFKNRIEQKNKKSIINQSKINNNKVNNSKKTKTINVDINNKNEDIDISSPDEKNIIIVKHIKPASRIIYNQKIPIILSILQRGKSQDIILRKKNKKRKKDINPIKTNIYIDKDYPEDSDANTKSIKIKINSNKTKQLFKMVKINKVKKINIKNKIKKTIPLIGPQNNKNYSTDNVIERCKIKEKDMKNI